MKTNVTKLMFLAALSGLFTNSITAAPAEETPGRMYRVTEVMMHGHPTIAVGTSLNFVRQVIGSAHEQITPDLWLYHNYGKAYNEAGRNDCSELLIHFVDERVASIHLANPRARGVIVARVNDDASELVALGTEPDVPPGMQIAKKE
jgi:hypothetical protein